MGTIDAGSLYILPEALLRFRSTFVPKGKPAWLGLDLGQRQFKGQLYPANARPTPADGETSDTHRRAPFVLLGAGDADGPLGPGEFAGLDLAAQELGAA